METIKCLQNAIDFIEDNLLETLTPDVIASHAYMSNFQFQKVFNAVCGITLGEYIRNRKLTLAGFEITSTNTKIIDIALKYGYESHESFTRAFSRFHNLSPMMARNQGKNIQNLPKITVNTILGEKNMMNLLKDRGYNVKENGPVYYTKDMVKTAKWFEEVLGWFSSIDMKDSAGNGLYGCTMPIPVELLNMKITPFSGIHLFQGEPSAQTVAFMRIDDIEKLHKYVKQNGWQQISEIQSQPWGAKECAVTTIDGSVMRFFQLD